ncbi:Npt1/Npt2 family nucleotide transporter [Psychroserpens algicola]|uniref:MFS transporter n=1 Tax=Psychroserpens algicola TaxID=1719034 RepID=A0ABT0H650_9FLAO|nr:Npt1/Npt2 family nucleotide transporter [Psychroserpens algicola]MCK8479864.1 MFS transporter [Psychroserpens algicola]
MLKTLINKTFGLRDGEIYISFLMQLYIFIIITVLLIVKPTINALFLSQLGADNLPYGYLLVALVAVIASYFYNKLIQKFSLKKVTAISLIFFSLAFLGLSIILQYSLLDDWVLYLYYLGVSLFAVMATSQFWVLANMVFNAREAKRVFGFIGAGAIAGGVFGGYLTSLIVSSYGNKEVILLAALLVLCCIPLMHLIWKLRVHKLNTFIRVQRKYNEDTIETSSFRLISNSKHLTYLALITGISVIVAKLVDFQFSDFANKAISDPDHLASFFGFWFSTFNVVALGIQLFLTNRILSRLGVASTLLILPFIIALGSLLFLTFPELWVLIIIKGFDGSFKQSLNKAAVELSIMPIPLHIKNQAKSYIDVAVDSIATGIAGFMLIFLIRKLNLSTSYITIIILLFVFIWIILIYKLREAYFNSFRTNIQRTLENTENSAKPKFETTLKAARKILNHGQEYQILNLLEYLNSNKLNALKPSIVGLLNHPSNKIKIAAIQQFYIYDRGTALNQVEPLVNSNDDQLVFTALEYILNHSSINEHKFFNTYLNHESDYISNAALLCLAKEAPANQKLALQFDLYNRIEDRVTQASNPESTKRKTSIAELLITIAESGMTKYYGFIMSHLDNDDAYIKKHAIKAAGITANELFIDRLFDLLLDKTYRKASIKSLKNYGVKIIDYIINLEKTDTFNNNIASQLPKIISAFNTQKAVNVLLKLLNSKDIIIRLAASKALTKLKNDESKLHFNKRLLRKKIIKESAYYKRTLDAIASLQHAINLEMTQTNASVNSNEILGARHQIIQVLEDQSETSLHCIFNLLSLVYEESDIEITYSALLSDIKEARINALEFLDNLLQSQLKQSVLPLIEHYVLSNNESDASVLELQIMNEKVCLAMLIRNRGKKIKLVVIELIKASNNPTYKPLLNKLKKHQNKDVKFFAIDALESLKLPAIT